MEPTMHSRAKSHASNSPSLNDIDDTMEEESVRSVAKPLGLSHGHSIASESSLVLDDSHRDELDLPDDASVMEETVVAAQRLRELITELLPTITTAAALQSASESRRPLAASAADVDAYKESEVADPLSDLQDLLTN